MERQQVHKSEQLSPNMSMVIDYDEPLLKSSDILNAFNFALDNCCSIEKYQGSKTVYTYSHNGIKEYFLCGSITYLSHPHPIFKKRFQLKKWFKDFYNEHKNKPNERVRLIGLYHYQGLIIFVDFSIGDYIERKLNSSAAHVYSNDLFQAMTYGTFQKIDKNGNHITSVHFRKFKDYINGVAEENKIFSLFRKFNNKFVFGSWVNAVSAITEMKSANWYQWKGTEWAGWFLEFRISNFIDSEHCESVMMYIGNIKSNDMLDFDLLFKEDGFYGDLKASDIDKETAPLNDQESVLEAINHYGRLWYIIYEHETIKDSDRNNEMALARMQLIGKQHKENEPISYAERMKHSVNFKRMRIFELNRINMNEVLSTFNQGHQPSGQPRAPKFLINKNNVDNYIVFSYDYQ